MTGPLHRVPRAWCACVVMTLAAGSSLVAQRVWQDTPLAQWTRADATKVLTSSPWARTVTIRVLDAGASNDQSSAVSMAGGGRPGDIPMPTRSDGGAAGRSHPVLVTWVALPIRMAHARLAQFDGHLQNPEYLAQALRGDARIMQIDLVGPVLGALVTQTDAAIARQSFLRTKAGRTIPVATVVFAKDFPANPRISLAFPAQRDGQAVLTPDDREVSVVVQLGGYVLNAVFPLREMVVSGAASL